MDPLLIRSNQTRSGATYKTPPDEDIASGGLPAQVHPPANTSQACLAGEGLATSPPIGDPATDAFPQSTAGHTVPVYSQSPANTLPTCLAGEGLATKPPPRGDLAPDAPPQSSAGEITISPPCADPAPADHARAQSEDYTTPISPELRTFLAAQTYICLLYTW